MITKEQYIQSLTWEIQVIKHLAEKVDPAQLDYRPTPKQRSTLELMQYLGHVVKTSIEISISGDASKFAEYAKAKDAVTFENFATKMEEQAEYAKGAVDALNEEDMKRETEMFGTKAALAMHLVNILKWVTAYKMQLFLYIKACGNDTIGTSNVWGGRDMPPKE